MKRILCCIVLVLLFASVCEAQQIIVMKKKAAGTCNSASDEVGQRTEITTATTTNGINYLTCYPRTADCTGTLGYGYVYHYATDEDTVKVCVYTYDGSGDPAVGDTKVACSSATTCNSSSVCRTADKLGGSVTQGSNYLVCFVTGTVFDIYRTTATGVTAYVNTSSSYATPPDNLNGTWGAYSPRDMTLYVEIE